MKVDYHHVEDKHNDIHQRLLNWASWVTPRSPSWISPMFRMYRSKAWQWHTPEYRVTCDTLDALAVEKGVSRLPEPHRSAVRWAYVVRCSPMHACKALGLSHEGLYRVLRDGRQMLSNTTQKSHDSIPEVG